MTASSVNVIVFSKLNSVESHDKGLGIGEQSGFSGEVNNESCQGVAFQPSNAAQAYIFSRIWYTALFASILF